MGWKSSNSSCLRKYLIKLLPITQKADHLLIKYVENGSKMAGKKSEYLLAVLNSCKLDRLASFQTKVKRNSAQLRSTLSPAVKGN